MARSGYHRSGDPLTDALARTRPKRVRVEPEGADAHEVRTDGARVRWSSVAATIRELADGVAARVVMLDEQGATVGVVRVPPAEDAPAPPTTAAPMDARDERILSLLVSAQKAALEEQRVLLGPVLESYTQLAAGYAQYAAQVVELVRLARSIEAEAPASSPADAALVELATKLGATKPPANGAA